jgi:hypothetical protein
MNRLALTASQWDVLINAVGLAGILLLAIPAFYANKYARLLARIGQGEPTSPALKAKHAQLTKELQELKGDWTPWKGNALIWGTVLTGLSNLFGLIKALVTNPS